MCAGSQVVEQNGAAIEDLQRHAQGSTKVPVAGLLQ